MNTAAALSSGWFAFQSFMQSSPCCLDPGFGRPLHAKLKMLEETEARLAYRLIYRQLKIVFFVLLFHGNGRRSSSLCKWQQPHVVQLASAYLKWNAVIRWTRRCVNLHRIWAGRSHGPRCLRRAFWGKSTSNTGERMLSCCLESVLFVMLLLYVCFCFVFCVICCCVVLFCCCLVAFASISISLWFCFSNTGHAKVDWTLTLNFATEHLKLNLPRRFWRVFAACFAAL